MKERTGIMACSTIVVLFLLSGAFFVFDTGMAVAAQDGDYTYAISGSPAVATITGYTGVGGAITIPSTLGGYAVVAIGDSAFSYATSISSVTIPTGVTVIGNQSFLHCTSMAYVTIPNGVTSLGYGAFDHCIALTSVTIPESVTSIGDYGFSACIALQSVTIPNSITLIGNGTFSICWSLTSITIPNSVTTIGDLAFDRCNGTASVTIGSGVTTIGNHSFDQCSNLLSITFLRLSAPTSVGAYWLLDTPSELRGHALAASNFPATGGSLSGLTMGSVLAGAQTAPGAPTDLHAVAGNSYVVLTWTAPANAGSPGIGWYIVYRGVSSGVYVGIDTENPGTTTFEDMTVTPGVLYYYVVRATNSVGLSAPTNEVTVTLGGPAIPSAPQGLVVKFNPNNITLTWNVPAEDGGAGILHYNIFRANSSGGHYTNIGNVSASTLTYLDVNGTANDSYSYYVVAVNSIGEGTQSSIQGKSASSSILQAALPPVAAVAVGSSLALLGAFVASRASETATTVSNGVDSVRSYMRRLFRLDKVFDFVTGYFRGRAYSFIWKHVAKVEPEDINAVHRQPLFAGFSAWEMGVIFFTSVFLGLAFMITNRIDLGSPTTWLMYIFVAGLAVSLHDLVHRYMAWRHGVITEYKFWFLGTGIMFLTAILFGVVYSSPSRLAINDPKGLTKKQQAIVYGSGPLMSFGVFAVFLTLVPLGGDLATIGLLGASMNLLTATYAMMPFEPMDGRRVYNWKKLVWVVPFVALLALYFILTIFVL